MTIIIFIIVLVVLILVHELGHFLFAKWCGIRVDEFGIGFPPRLLGFKPKGGETTYSLNAIPFGGFVKIYGEDYESIGSEGDRRKSFAYQPKWKQALVLFAGVFFNTVLAWLLLSIALMLGAGYSPDGRYGDRVEDVGTVVTNVLGDSPAGEAGFKPGDMILFASAGDAVQGDEVTPETVTSIISGSGGAPVEFLLNRNEEIISIIVTPSDELVPETLAVGISMTYAGTLTLPVHLALFEGFRITGELVWAIISGLGGLIIDAFSGGADFSSLVGPVGIAGLARDAASAGVVSLISFVAIISLHLAVLNLIPFPALDGGRILFVIIEKIKGSPMNAKIAGAINLVGFLLLIGLLLIVTYKDIVRLF